MEADRSDLERLMLAFSWHMAREIVDADARTERSELVFLEQNYPRALLEQVGFVDVDGNDTTGFLEARDRALVELPDRLTTGEKLALLEGLVEATAADGLLRAEEVDAVAAVARILGVEDVEWTHQIADLVASGRLRPET